MSKQFFFLEWVSIDWLIKTTFSTNKRTNIFPEFKTSFCLVWWFQFKINCTSSLSLSLSLSVHIWPLLSTSKTMNNHHHTAALDFICKGPTLLIGFGPGWRPKPAWIYSRKKTPTFNFFKHYIFVMILSSQFAIIKKCKTVCNPLRFRSPFTTRFIGPHLNGLS